jgi:hypothetical protein
MGAREPAIRELPEQVEDRGTGPDTLGFNEELRPRQRPNRKRLANVIDHLDTSDRNIRGISRDGLAGHRCPPITPL